MASISEKQFRTIMAQLRSATGRAACEANHRYTRRILHGLVQRMQNVADDGYAMCAVCCELLLDRGSFSRVEPSSSRESADAANSDDQERRGQAEAKERAIKQVVGLPCRIPCSVAHMSRATPIGSPALGMDEWEHGTYSRPSQSSDTRPSPPPFTASTPPSVGRTSIPPPPPTSSRSRSCTANGLDPPRPDSSAA